MFYFSLYLFPVIHVNVDTKIKSKERLGFDVVVVVFSLPVSPGGHARWPFDICRRMPDFDSCNKQNNNFARASHFFVHFFPVFAPLRLENAFFLVL